MTEAGAGGAERSTGEDEPGAERDAGGDGTPRIEAVISDFGGVLTTPLVQSFMAFQDETGISAETLGKAMQAAAEANGENPLFEMERGEISEASFLETITDCLEPLLGHRPHMHRFKEIYFEALDPNPPMIELMRELRAEGYRMAMLTNNVREWEPLWRSMLPVDEIFETVVDSGFVGCRKPESRIYGLTLERIDLAAQSCLFVDDVQVNCEGAQKAGMTAVHFQGNDQAIAEIRASLG
jgi:putative hydrolase of the HAD superfamily